MSDSLDDKLREILNEYFMGASIKPQNDDYDKAATIKDLKQAFIDEGWVHSPLVDYQFKRIKDGQLMTGQEWLARFEDRLKASAGKRLTDSEMMLLSKVLEAARKAAGLE